MSKSRKSTMQTIKSGQDYGFTLIYAWLTTSLTMDYYYICNANLNTVVFNQISVIYRIMH